MKQFLALSVVLLVVSCGKGPQLETRTFQLRYLDGFAAHDIVKPYVYEDREGAPGQLSATSQVLTVRETPDNLEKIARVLAQVDRPQKSVRLYFQIIEADGVARTDTAIAPIESALRQLFRFKGYRLLGTAVIAGTEGAELAQGVSRELAVRAQIFQVRGSGDSATVRLSVQLVPYGGLKAEVTAPVGQTLVIGSTSVFNQNLKTNQVLILTVRPELVN